MLGYTRLGDANLANQGEFDTRSVHVELDSMFFSALLPSEQIDSYLYKLLRSTITQYCCGRFDI